MKTWMWNNKELQENRVVFKRITMASKAKINYKQSSNIVEKECSDVACNFLKIWTFLASFKTTISQWGI